MKSHIRLIRGTDTNVCLTDFFLEEEGTLSFNETVDFFNSLGLGQLKRATRSQAVIP